MCLSFKLLIDSGIRPYPKVAFVQSRVENCSSICCKQVMFFDLEATKYNYI